MTVTTVTGRLGSRGPSLTFPSKGSQERRESSSPLRALRLEYSTVHQRYCCHQQFVCGAGDWVENNAVCSGTAAILMVCGLIATRY